MINAVIILGMHRSGTSCLTGCLQEAGLYLGNVIEAAPHNVKGNRENRMIMDLHEEVLATSGGSWDSPPDTVVWSAEQEQRKDALIATYPRDRLWGFKDPRTLLTLEGWMKALPLARHVATFRHPLAVALSLQRRNGMSLERALDLWVAYNRRLIRYKHELDFDLINFDLPSDAYIAKLDAIARGLGLAFNSAEFRFFEPALRNERGPDTPMSGEVGSVYAELLEASV